MYFSEYMFYFNKKTFPTLKKNKTKKNTETQTTEEREVLT